MQIVGDILAGFVLILVAFSFYKDVRDFEKEQYSGGINTTVAAVFLLFYIASICWFAGLRTWL